MGTPNRIDGSWLTRSVRHVKARSAARSPPHRAPIFSGSKIGPASSGRGEAKNLYETIELSNTQYPMKLGRSGFGRWMLDARRSLLNVSAFGQACAFSATTHPWPATAPTDSRASPTPPTRGGPVHFSLWVRGRIHPRQRLRRREF